MATDPASPATDNPAPAGRGAAPRAAGGPGGLPPFELGSAVLLGIGSGSASLWAELAGHGQLQLWTKAGPVLAMLWVLGRSRRDSYARLLCYGLAWSALGDVLLEVGEVGFLAGMGAFLLAHLCYLAAFVGEERRWRPLRALPFALWGGAVLAWLWPGLEAAGMTVPVTIYTAVICAMMWRAVARAELPGPSPAKEGSSLRPRARASLDISIGLAIAGSLTFAASDTLIAVRRFGEPAGPGAAVAFTVSILLLYWLGQLGLMGSAMARRPSPSASSAPGRG
ncbi:MAG: lysoplasmalogenase [Holophagales bacterium]|nr:lysoplasmalogenase [Holophagales bacterium]